MEDLQSSAIIVLAIVGSILLVVRNRSEWMPAFSRENLCVVAKRAPSVTRALKQLLLPGTAMVVYGLILYVPDQSAALRRALGVTFFPGGDFPEIGFRASWKQGVAWIAINILFLGSLWLYHRLTIEKDSRKPEGQRSEPLDPVTVAAGGLLLSVSAQVLFVGPLVSSPQVLLSPLRYSILLAIIYVALTRSAFIGKPKSAILILSVALSLISIFTFIGEYLIPIIVIPATLFIFTFYFPEKDRRFNLRESLDAILAYAGAMAALMFSMQLFRLFPSGRPANVMQAVYLTAVWLGPAIICAFLMNFAQKIVNFRWWGIAICQAFVAMLCYIIYTTWGGAMALTAVPLALMIFCSIALMVRLTGNWASHLVAWGAIFGLIGIGVAFEKLLPQLSPVKNGYTTTSSKVDDKFKDYYDKWEKFHGKNEPIILIAAAGGGIRAAQHVADSLAYADDYTRGAFGNHIFAISAVSGGALGALIWDSARNDGLFPRYSTNERGVRFLNGEVVNRFFTSDFLSPSANELVLHDLPHAAWPWSTSKAKRDEALEAAWLSAWKAMRSMSEGRSADDWEFKRSFEMNVDLYGLQPILVFNSTSAADGQLTVRSNVPLMADGNRVLSPTVHRVHAVLDSARFPFVSTVGYECSNEAALGPIPSEEQKCSRNVTYSHTLAITDGGYADNSGLASINYIISKLSTVGADPSRIFVVFISSNPEDGRSFIDGNRFDSSSLTGTIFSPILMLDTARAGRAAAYRKLVAGAVEKDNFIEWSLTNATSNDIPGSILKHAQSGDASSSEKSSGISVNESQRNSKEDAIQISKTLPPLGWTLDTVAARGISLVSESHTFFMSQGCKAGIGLGKSLCSMLIE
ncbi:hypothetical protein [Ralstonia pickettii]|uniref:hypothetical protein n=1 Tax=Ralstonia pickettii TaxID=329 RepID=UPI0015C09D93|nr:hypothetical protein [Ralstonia pickettii]NWK46421.1 hypothetical protein [Ralstonia pickettii]